MEIKRTTEIVVKKNRRFVVRQQEHTEQVFCSSCCESMLTAEQTAAREEADAILVEMKQVLDKMLELETLNGLGEPTNPVGHRTRRPQVTTVG